MRQPSQSSMYAISGSSSVYHLLYPDEDYTLCGFKAKKHDAKIPAKAVLHVVEFLPANRELCKQCEKMNNRRKGNSEGPDLSGPNPELSCHKRVQDESTPFQVHP
jgi:hypothetical protein